MNPLGTVSLRWAISGIVILCLLPIWALLSFELMRHDRDVHRLSAQTIAESQLQIAQRAMKAPGAGGPEDAFRQVQSLVQGSHVTKLMLVRDDGVVLQGPESAWNGKPLERVAQPLAEAFRNRGTRRFVAYPDQMRFAAIGEIGAAGGDPTARAGWLVLELDFSSARWHLERHILLQALFGLLPIALGAFLIWLWLDRLTTRPLRLLQAAVQSAARGGQDSLPVLGGAKEVVELAAAFGRMSDELRQRHESERRQRRLYAALSDTNQNIVRVRDPKELLDRTCRIAIDVGFRLAWIGRLDKLGNLRAATAAGPAAFRLEGAGGERRAAQDPLAQAVREGRESVVLFSPVGHVSPWENEALSHGLVGGATFPLLNGSELLGGLVVMTDQPALLDEQAQEMLREMAGDVAYGLTNLESEGTRGRMERRLGEERALLRALIDSIPDLIFFKDHGHVYLGCNRAFEQLVGRKEGELLGGNEFDLFDREQAERFRAQDEQVLQSGRSIRYEQWVEYPDGRRVLLDTLKLPFTGPDGGILGLIGIARDITELREQVEKQFELEKQLRQTQKMEAVGQLTGGIAHDFNNILASILGFTDLALRHRENVDEKLQDYLRRIDVAARRGTDLVAQLLTFSRGGSTDQSMPLEPGPMVKETLKLLRATLPAGIQLTTDFESDLPRIVMDPVHLNQVVMNLCINARDALGEKGEISVGLRRRVDYAGTCLACGRRFDGDWVELSVTDNGPGVRDEHRTHLFEPFYTTKPKGKGSGMGLAVVHGIQLSYGGHVLLDSTPEKGTCFRVFYPVVEPNEPEKALDSPVSEDEGWRSLRRKRVMVVDDEPAITAYLKEFLELQGLEVEAYTHSPTALERLREGAGMFHLLITDQAMPELTGLELVAQAKQLSPQLPVILCSGFSHGINASNAGEHGVDCYLDKPVTPRNLLPHMHAVMRTGNHVP